MVVKRLQVVGKEKEPLSLLIEKARRDRMNFFKNQRLREQARETIQIIKPEINYN